MKQDASRLMILVTLCTLLAIPLLTVRQPRAHNLPIPLWRLCPDI